MAEKIEEVVEEVVDTATLDELLAEQEALAKRVRAKQRAGKDEALKTIKQLVLKHNLNTTDLAHFFGFEAPKEPLEKKIVKKAEPKWQYVSNGVVVKWAGRGNPKTFPQTLKDYLAEKKITIEQFKADPKHKITVA